MPHSRQSSLRALALSLLVGSYSLFAQQQPAPPKPPNPFEAVTEAAAPAKPVVDTDVIESVEFRGSRRVPQDTLRAMIFTKRGDVYSEQIGRAHV